MNQSNLTSGFEIKSPAILEYAERETLGEYQTLADRRQKGIPDGQKH